jgi:hypothetical protein
MLRIKVDMMSGLPNPEWIVTDPDATKELLDAVADAPGVAAEIGTGFIGLGYRELRVSLIEDDAQLPRGVPPEFALGSLASGDFQASIALARGLVEDMTRYADVELPAHRNMPITDLLRDRILRQLDVFGSDPPPRDPSPGRRHDHRRSRGPWPHRSRVVGDYGDFTEVPSTIKDDLCECKFEVSKVNAGFWNDPAHITHNNCYNYALNCRIDHKLGPGFRLGLAEAAGPSGYYVGVISDGLVDRCECLPDSEFPRRLVALASQTEDDGGDFHFYRFHQEGYWAHKPGENVVSIRDHSDLEIHDPKEADRGSYETFHGYFYAGRSVVAGLKK